MKSRLAKVLHPVAGRPMLDYPLSMAEELAPSRLVVVIGRDADRVEATFSGRARFVVQAERLGTGHAVKQAQPELKGFAGDVAVLYGDTPLLRAETLRAMQRHKAETGAALVMLATRMPLPGIVVRDAAGAVRRIVERPDASPEELALTEFNTGVYLIDADFLWDGLEALRDDNAQGEFYLTDLVAVAVTRGHGVAALTLEDDDEALGVNDRSDLARAQAVARRRHAERLMASGVTIVDPENTYIDTDVEVGPDTQTDPGCVVSGPTRIGEGVHLKAHCVVEESVIGDDSVIGPSAHLRPHTRLGAGVRIGNYVEVKNSVLGAGVKADHLSYIGDADVGAGASFGCGSIVVNYDGVEKHRTKVGEGAFIGCNVNLVAPVTVEASSFVAAGSTITKSVPKDSLAVARERQRNVKGWVSRRQDKKE
ncbi:MAG: bifunctional UDP-N-acetylglucosamine diphosphorylase/glucosamine-1-phosphate N-acetyltransferase GlmU [Myxococcales bacterium]|nr:bifunctional UDP-N-acetylglucosamine diphosphorylase/glucosamine-1-phosphate N-acetyltransferase GlmU [Myxococcales bacterium]